MARRIEVEIQMGHPHPEGTKKTYMMTEFDLDMLLECNEVFWPDFTEDCKAFCVCECAHYDEHGSMTKVTMLMLTTLERDYVSPEPFRQSDSEHTD